MSKPLISYILVCFNQEPFIREAVRSALSQTYSPLEVIVTDDCSSDRTFELVREIVSDYRGPHLVKLTRSTKNTGIGGNINRAMDLARGDWVVVAAGDDISLPNRTEVIYEAWEYSGRRAISIFSSYYIISRNGVEKRIGGFRSAAEGNGCFRFLQGDLLTFLRQQTPAVNGCTNSWSPSLFRYFGPLRSDLEDLVLSFRTVAIGSMLYIDKPLVKYRRHGDNSSFLAGGDDAQSFEHREKRLRLVNERSEESYHDMLLDVETLYKNGKITIAYRDFLKVEGERITRSYRLEKMMMEGRFHKRFMLLVDAIHRREYRAAIKCSWRLLPVGVYKFLYLLRSRWRLLIRHLFAHLHRLKR